MPYKKELAKRKKLSPVALAYLTDGEVSGKEDEGSLWCYRVGLPGFFDDDIHPKELWEKYRSEFLSIFIEKYPGRRPLPWWAFDAPRQLDHGSGAWFEGTFPEPRKQISGAGELHKGYVPEYRYGIPQHWDAKTLNPAEPLAFESQTSYLLRNNLLSCEEEKYLAGHPELLEPEKITL